jgi:hypothetical protein
MSVFNLHTDKNSNFECRIELEGASLKNAIARIVVESQKLNLVFNGTITEHGKCTVHIQEMKGLLEEHTKGKIWLEVIAEDTYFQPWESNFEVVPSKKMTVEVVSATTQSTTPKPTIKVTQPVNPKTLAVRIVEDLRDMGVTIYNMDKSHNLVKKCVLEHVSKLDQHVDSAEIISHIIKLISNSQPTR